MTKKALAIFLIFPFIAYSQSINKNEWQGKIKSVITWYSYINYDVSLIDECKEKAEYLTEYQFNKQGFLICIISPSFSAFRNYLDTFYYDKNDQNVKTERYRQYTDSIKDLDSYAIFSFDSLSKRNSTKRYDGANNLTAVVIYDEKNKFLEKRKWNYSTKKFDTTFIDDENRNEMDTTCVDEKYNDNGDLIERYYLKATYDTLRKLKPGSSIKKKGKQITVYDSLGNEINLLLLPKGNKIIKLSHTYEYDSYQNWIKQFYFKNDKLDFINYRKIEYY